MIQIEGVQVEVTSAGAYISVRDERKEPYVIYGDMRGFEAAIRLALSHDFFVRMHLLHVNRLAFRWSAAVGLSAEDRTLLLRAALIHDVGKAAIPTEILSAPRGLTSDEWVVMKKHVELGVDFVEKLTGCSDVAYVISQHHERYAGNGYPRGITHEEIHPIARMVSVIDSFSAMVDPRPYRRQATEAEALRELERCAGEQFDPGLVESFVQLRRTPVVERTAS